MKIRNARTSRVPLSLVSLPLPALSGGPLLLPVLSDLLLLLQRLFFGRPLVQQLACEDSDYGCSKGWQNNIVTVIPHLPCSIVGGFFGQVLRTSSRGRFSRFPARLGG